MFWHIFSSRVKCLVRNKTVTFWTLAFPIVLATLFALAFSNLSIEDRFSKIKVAVVDNAAFQNNRAFQTALFRESSPGQETLFDICLTTVEQAEEMLENNKIAGYVWLDDRIHLVVREYDVNQAIIKEFLDNYVQTYATMTSIASNNSRAWPEVIARAGQKQNYLQEVSPTRSKPNTPLNYYYALIAMACLFGGFRGLGEVSAVQADLSPEGARVSLSPVHKLKVFGYSLCAAVVVQLVSLFIVLAYLGLVLKVDFGNNLAYVLLAVFAGNLAGVSLGAMIGALVKKAENIKIAVLVSGSLLLSFLSGLMISDVRYMVTHAVPALAYVNPANLITDAFYSLYCYDAYTRFFTNIELLLALSGVFFLIVYLVLRRQRYASL